MTDSPKKTIDTNENPNADGPPRPLWAKDGLEIDPAIVRYCAGEDWKLDARLLGCDLRGTLAHVSGLREINALSANEAEALQKELRTLLAEHEAGTFLPTPDDEDGHSAIERVLCERLGDVGKKVHLGRSRNDQVLTATRLWLKEQLATAASLCVKSAETAFQRAEKLQGAYLPGYTHLQRAVPSTVGYWFAGHGESLLEDAEALWAASDLIDASPLGTAAGYGVNLPLARDLCAGELGFSRLIVNGLAAQNGRGRLEAHALSALLCAMGTVRRLAWDLSLFSMSELGFVRLPEAYTTGSSIMPNKRNPDVVEIMRAAFGDVAGAHAAILQVIALPSGYQRDTQRTKQPMMQSVAVALDTLFLLPTLLSELHFDAERANAAVDAGMLATDRAVELSVGGMPFRDAYRQVAHELKANDDAADEEVLKKGAVQSVAGRISLGGPGNLALERLRQRAHSLTQGRASLPPE